MRAKEARSGAPTGPLVGKVNSESGYFIPRRRERVRRIRNRKGRDMRSALRLNKLPTKRMHASHFALRIGGNNHRGGALALLQAPQRPVPFSRALSSYYVSHCVVLIYYIPAQGHVTTHVAMSSSLKSYGSEHTTALRGRPPPRPSNRIKIIKASEARSRVNEFFSLALLYRCGI